MYVYIRVMLMRACIYSIICESCRFREIKIPLCLFFFHTHLLDTLFFSVIFFSVASLAYNDDWLSALLSLSMSFYNNYFSIFPFCRLLIYKVIFFAAVAVVGAAATSVA